MATRRKKETETEATAPEPALDETVADDVPVEESEAELAETVSIERVVTFHLGGQRYGLPIESVQEIQQIVAFSDVPGGHGSLVGMVNLRGAVIPAIDMRSLIGLPREEYHLDTPMIICRVGDDLVALVVEEVEDVIVLPTGRIMAPPKLHALSDRMIGVCHLDDGLVFLLDVERIVKRVDLGMI